MKETLRKILLDLYNIDIEGCEYHISSMNSFMIEVGDYTFRFILNVELSRKESMARMMWADDLKLFKNTICEPIPSVNNKLIEDIKLKQWDFSVSLYQSAKGKFLPPSEIRPIFLINSGDMIGTIHSVSMDQYKSGMNYKLSSIFDGFDILKENTWSYINSNLQNRIESIVNKCRSIEINGENYGVCFNEYDLNNIMVDTNNIMLFDFSSAAYGYYLYDVACFVLSVIWSDYLPDRNSKDLVFKNIIPWFRIGYSINKPCDNHSFDDIEQFMGLRLAMLLLTHVGHDNEDDIKKRLDYIKDISAILSAKDIFTGIDNYRKEYKDHE